MSTVDADVCDLHVTIKGHFSSLPYIDPLSGLTTMDMPIESAEITDQMYEPRKHDLCTATVTFPSVMQRPELRPLLQSIIHGSRVEIYNFQPDCGNPVFSGYIPPEGLSESDGKLTITVHDPLVRGTWDSVSRMERDFSSQVTDLYTRGMETFQDLVNDDFTHAATFNQRWVPAGYVGTPVNFAGGEAAAYSNQGSTRSGFIVQAQDAPVNMVVGDVFIVEADVIFYGDLHAQAQTPDATPVNYAWQHVSVGMYNGKPYGNIGVTYEMSGDNTGITNPLGRYAETITATRGLAHGDDPVPGDICSTTNLNTGTTTWTRTKTQPVGLNVPFRISCLIRINPNNRCSVYANRSGYPVSQLTDQPVYSYHSGDETKCGIQPEIAQTNDLLLGWRPYFELVSFYDYSGRVAVRNLRARRLTPYIARAPRFVPQTSDYKYYMPSGETARDFLDHWVEQDNAEYRVLYKIAPALDQLELDAVSTLGVTAAPSYTFEEGVNLGGPPRRNPRATPHANDIIRTGSGSQASESQAEAFSVAEVGNPVDQAWAPRTYPYFQSKVSDSSVTLDSIALTLAKYDLIRATSPTPSVTLEHVESVDTAFSVRAGDTVPLKTQSLITNLDQNMRVMQIKHRSGQPTREITVGKLENDPLSLRELHKAILQQNLYAASGDSSSSSWTYAFCPWAWPQNTPAGSASPVFQPTIDQYTRNTQYIAAELHWYMQQGTANQIFAYLNGTMFSTASTSTDSGVIECTRAFQNAGAFDWHFVTAAGTTAAFPILAEASLILRVRL